MGELVHKSRHLPLSEFYTKLQLEYISYFVRSMIYPGEYGERYKGYCLRKKEKIEKIGLKNALPSIFNSENIKNKYINNFFNPRGLPNFEYRDDKSRELMGHYDKVYWFSRGTTVRYEFSNEVGTSLVKFNHPKENRVTVKIGVLDVDFGYTEISRIITESLINF